MDCYLISNGKLKLAKLPENLLAELCINLREYGKEVVHFADHSIEVEGIYIPAKGTKIRIMVLPESDLI